MKYSLLSVIALSLLLWGCASSGFPPQTAEATDKVPFDKRIEVSLSPETFEITEVEFHVDQESIPEAILAKAKQLIPDAYVGDCEIEYHDGDVFYEVTCSAKGIEQEVMFTEEGEPYRWETEVDRAEVPEAAIKTAEDAVPGAWIKKCEAILDGDKKLLEYHFKIEKKGVKYKAVVSIDGWLIQLYRETKGEIEVPLK